jgi:hypothetical protein
MPDARTPRFLPLFLLALAVRLVVVALGVLLAQRPPHDPRPLDPTANAILDRVEGGSAKVVAPWYRWDAVWYVNVAENGYAGASDSGGRLGVAFLPALPAVMALASTLGLNLFWIGVIVPNLAAAAGTAVMARVAARLTESRETGLRTFALLLAFPTAFFFSAPYNEAFGLLFGALALSAWQRERTKTAAALALLSSLSRMTSITLGVAAIGAWVLNPKRTREGAKRAAWLAAGSFGGLVLFWGFLWWSVGDFFAGAKSQAAWGRAGPSVLNPWIAITDALNPDYPRYGDLLAVVACAILGVLAWVKRGAFWGILVLVPVAQMLATGTLLSGSRLVLACLPAFVELAPLVRARVLFVAVVGAFAAVQVVLLDRFVHWVFAG